MHEGCSLCISNLHADSGFVHAVSFTVKLVAKDQLYCFPEILIGLMIKITPDWSLLYSIFLFNKVVFSLIAIRICIVLTFDLYLRSMLQGDFIFVYSHLLISVGTHEFY